MTFLSSQVIFLQLRFFLSYKGVQTIIASRKRSGLQSHINCIQETLPEFDESDVQVESQLLLYDEVKYLLYLKAILLVYVLTALRLFD